MCNCVSDDMMNLFFNEVYGTSKKIDVSSSVLKGYKKEFKILEKLCRVLLA